MQSDAFRALLDKYVVDWVVTEKQSVMHLSGQLNMRGYYVEVNLRGNREAVQDVIEGLVRTLSAGERLKRA